MYEWINGFEGFIRPRLRLSSAFFSGVVGWVISMEQNHVRVRGTANKQLRCGFVIRLVGPVTLDTTASRSRVKAQSIPDVLLGYICTLVLCFATCCMCFCSSGIQVTVLILFLFTCNVFRLRMKRTNLCTTRMLRKRSTSSSD